MVHAGSVDETAGFSFIQGTDLSPEDQRSNYGRIQQGKHSLLRMNGPNYHFWLYQMVLMPVLKSFHTSPSCAKAPLRQVRQKYLALVSLVLLVQDRSEQTDSR